MKNIIAGLLFAVLMLTSACGGYGYDADKANKLVEKINSSQSLSQDDYSEIINQCDGALDLIDQKISAIRQIDDPSGKNEAFMKTISDEEFRQAAANSQIMMIALETARLNAENEKAFNELLAKMRQTASSF